MDTVRLEENKDAMVLIKDYIPDAVIHLPYASDQNFMGKKIYDFSDAYLRLGTLRKLMKAAEEMRANGYRLLIWDAYRPPKAQFLMWKVMPDSTYIANPYKGFSKHSRGNTVDVSLTDMEGNPVPMPSAFDDFTLRAQRDYRHLEASVRERILLLETAMKKNGFIPLYDEWWHYHDEEDYPICDGPEPLFLKQEN